MKKNKINLSREQLEEVIQLFNRSMDDYLYLFDIQNDYYSISKHAVSRFCLPNYHFCDATKAHNYFVYEDDLPLLFDEFNKIKSGEITEHSLHYRWLDRQHNPVWVNCRGDVILDEFNKPLYLIGCVNEIGKRQKADNISGLLREPSLEEYVSSKSKNNITGYFMQIGIDDFDEINGRFGLKCGDEILKQFSMCMQSCINENQKIYELGNGRFIIMDLANHSKEDILELYDELKKSVEVALEENVYRVVYTISVGIVEIDKEMKDYDTLIKYSDFALNEAKKKGKNSCYFFTQDKYKQFIRRREIRVELQNAVDHNFKNFDVYYQPIIDIHTRNLIGAEALMRFTSEKLGIISPAEFIPILEETGLIIPAGRWMMREAMGKCSEIRKVLPGFRVSINISQVQASKSDVIQDISAEMKRAGLSLEALIVELTESDLLEQNINEKHFLTELKRMGISLALDDFGTGYSNFHYLSELKPEIIKIDRSFTVKAVADEQEYYLLNQFCTMIHNLDLRICIEGVENEQEWAMIRKLYPEFTLGYFWGKPCEYEEFMRKFTESRL